MKEKNINTIIIEAINQYKHLSLSGKDIVTPYYINEKHNKDLRAMVGKGTPEEIIMEAKIWEKLKGVDFTTMHENDIKQFLIDRGIGIDCSGFIIHILDSYSMKLNKKHIWSILKYPKKDILSQIKYILRPVEHLGAEIITDEENTDKIKVKDVLPGDLIRSKAKRSKGHHIMIVSKVTYDDQNNPILIQYTHSSPYYGMNNGIKQGEIKILDPNKELQDQEWLEKDEFGVVHTYEGFLREVEDNGLRRLKNIKFPNLS